jgi:hypothetical protein
LREPQGFERPKATITASVGHHREWLQAIRTGGATACNFDYSGVWLSVGRPVSRSLSPVNWQTLFVDFGT